jgi:hypothetical protein
VLEVDTDDATNGVGRVPVLIVITILLTKGENIDWNDENLHYTSGFDSKNWSIFFSSSLYDGCFVSKTIPSSSSQFK